MADLALVLVALVQGAVLGLVAYDMQLRKADKLEREAAKAELQKTQAALAELHNKNAETMRSLQDKVNAHAMALAAGRMTK